MATQSRPTRTRQDLINTGEAFGKSEAEKLRSGSSNSLSSQQSGAHQQQQQLDKRRAKKRLGEFCYSIANVVLIVAAVIALCVLIKFVQDDPLHKYGEHLLSLHFYRELIFIICLLPLVLLLPVFNALSGLCLSGAHSAARNKSRAFLRLKLAYQLLLCLLALLALFFVAPYVRATNLSSQLELEFRKHMKFRYERQFSHEFLDEIQETYKCCDQFWYRANMDDQLPMSCFVPESNFGEVFEETCANALGSLVSLRCSIIAACLMLLLVSLASLFAIDLAQLNSISGAGGHQSNQYKVHNAQTAQAAQQQRQRAGSFQRRRDDDDADAERDCAHAGSVESGEQAAAAAAATAAVTRAPLTAAAAMIGGRDDPISELLRNERTGSRGARLLASQNRCPSLAERRRQVSLLLDDDHDDDDNVEENDDDDNKRSPRDRRTSMGRPAGVELSRAPDHFQQPLDKLEDLGPSAAAAGTGSPEPVLLARANLRLVERARSQSPRLTNLDQLDQLDQLEEVAAQPPPSSGAGWPIRSALKRAPSRELQPAANQEQQEQQEQEAGQRDADADSLDEYAQKLRHSNSLLRQKGGAALQREQATRRSLLSVRFAD